MSFDLNAFNEQYGTTLDNKAGNTQWNSGTPKTPAPKAPSFGSQVLHSLTTVPAQAAGAVVHAVADPFAHLISNAANAAGANKNAAAAEAASKALDQQSKQAKLDFQSGRLSRADYIAKTHAITQAAQDQSQTVQGQQVKSIRQMAPDAAQAIATTLTLGAGGIGVGGAKAAAEAAGEKLAGNVGAKVAGKVVQGGANLVRAGSGIGGPITDSGIGGVGKAVIQAPLKAAYNAAAVQPTVQYGIKSVHDVASGNIKGAAEDAALAAAPAVLGRAAGALKEFGPALKEALLGKSATLTDALGTKRITQYLAENADNPDNIAKLKRIEMFTENQPNVKNGVKTAGQQLADHIESELKLDPATTPIQKIVDNMDAYARNHEALQGAISAGLVHPEAVITHGVDSTVPTIAKEFAAHGDEQLSADTRVKMVNDALDRMGIENQTLRNKIGSEALSAGTTGSDIAAALTDMKQKIEIPTPKGLLDSGFTATYGPKSRAALPTLEEAKAAGAPEVGTEPHGVIGELGKFMQRKGIGIGVTPSSVTQKAITSNLDRRLAGTSLEGKAGDIMRALHQETSKTSGIYDPRMLRATNNSLGPARASVENALRSVGVTSPADARMVLKAVKGAYGDVPLGTRSLGEKVTDKLIQHISPMSTYLKAQGYGKFSANPFFWVKQATKGEFIGQAETGGKALNLGRFFNEMLGTAPSRDTMDILEKTGATSKVGAAGTEADALGTEAFGIHGNTAQVNEYIKQSIGQAAEQFAKNNGTTVKELVDPEHPLHHDFNHLMEMIVGYPKGDNILNSNLAKTLNVLVFPSRFEAKVGIAAAKYFAAQPKVTQLAMVNSLLRANAWSNSPEGQKFQKDNADIIGALNYFSPTHTLDSIHSFTKTGNAGDLGQVGGLPLGVITTILKHQGTQLPNFVAGEDTNPATSQPYTTRVPTTNKTRLQQGVQDLVGSMFAYPGATIGAPSKTKLINGVPGLGINPADQKTIGGAAPVGTPTPVSIVSNPSRPLPRVTPNVKPLYKTSTSKRVARPKVRAIKPANSKL